jgi:hypothetical protein
MSAVKTPPGELVAVAPEAIRYGTRQVRVGGTVFRAIEKVLAAGRVPVPVADLCLAVWGGPRCDETVRSLLWRANRLVEGLRCPKRLVLDRGQIALV